MDDVEQVVVSGQQFADASGDRLDREHPELEEDVLLALEVEVEEPLGHACGPADLGDGGVIDAFHPPQGDGAAHERASRLL